MYRVVLLKSMIIPDVDSNPAPTASETVKIS
jgi:hypothetical protein